MNIRRKGRLCIGVSTLIMALVANPAAAQTTNPTTPGDPAPQTNASSADAQDRRVAGDAPAQAGPDGPAGDIIVTGTLIRGIAPTGTNVVALSREAITATGAMNANDILATIPQVTTAFLNTPTVSANDGGIPYFRPNIRDLGRASGSTTLVLVDGHRTATIGGGAPDADAIPPGVLERVEIVPDGGSSTYGSDAIGGVINFITRKKFDGVEAIARYGFADAYHTTDINLTAGKTWNTGSAYISYAFQKNDAILGRDRDWMRQVTDDQGFCVPGTIVANNTTYALPGRVPGTLAKCDITDNVSFWPAVERNTIFGALTQDFGKSITFDVRGYYVRRDTTSSYDFNSAVPQTLTVGNTNPYFQSIAGETSQIVRTSFAGVYDSHARNKLREFQITPTLTARLGGDWQLRMMGNYGITELDQRITTADTGALNAALAGTTLATALNPYDLGASNPSVLASIARTNLGGNKTRLYNARALAEGPLMHLPGGEVRLAIGVEYERDKVTDQKNGQAVPGQEDSLPNAVPDFRRNIQSVFGEIAVPIFGADNAAPGFHSLLLSASARYDKYSDVGGTFNPKIGLTYEPVNWVRIRGNWGTSFNAPTPDQRSGIQVAGALPVPFVPGQQAPWTIILAGAAPDVRPQTAHTWSAGFDIRPPVLPGLKLSATYYNVFLKNQIGLLGLGQIALTPALANYVKDNQTCAAYLPKYAVQQIAFLVPLPLACAVNQKFAFIDLRQQNLGQLKQDGIDFDLTYNRKVSFGSINAGFAGSYTLSRKSAVVAGAPFSNDLANPGTSRFFFVTSLGLQAGALGANVTLNHKQGYQLTPAITTARFGTQDHVSSFNTVDLFLTYKLPAGWLNDQTLLTLNVSNLLDQDPPFYNGCVGTALCGFSNGSTLGRLVTFGLRTKF